MTEHAVEVRHGRRFQFGKNWKAFLAVLDEERISNAESSLKVYLDTSTLEGLTFLDAGSGSGLFSLAARRLGAEVYSFDYDPDSVECTRELRRRYFPDDAGWQIDYGSILDQEFVRRLGQFDIVYAWGVLHHTGSMWAALENAAGLVKAGGKLFIAIYNYQVYWTAFSTLLKRSYNHSPRIGKWMIAGAFTLFQVVKGLIKDLLSFRNPLRRYRQKKKMRGMSTWHDWMDWIGGYPFETAKPEEIFDFCAKRGFTLGKLRTAGGGHGCNEFVFQK